MEHHALSKYVWMKDLKPQLYCFEILVRKQERRKGGRRERERKEEKKEKEGKGRKVI